ncbi:MAG: tRNA (adenosine(37)-N6)-dimethylallyltransferase MiaA [Thermoguttaceae bacterium]
MTIFLTGCTASGKTALGIAVAEACDGEVISVDSMAIYRGMDIGTAKPSREERARVPHHLIDIVEPEENYSVADFLAAATNAERDIISRGRTPIFVGGTPLFLKAILCGMCDSPPEDVAFRQEMLDVAAREPAGTLHRRLAEVDPVTAARLHPNDTRRIVRALEVFTLTGVSLATQQTNFSQPQRKETVFVLTHPTHEVNRRIEERTRLLIKSGWLDEARELLKRRDETGRELGKTAMQAVGYRELFAVLRGETSLAAATDAIIIRTRQFAKRQRTWFRSLDNTQTVGADDAADILDLFGNLHSHIGSA